MPAVGDQHRGGPATIMMPNATGIIARNPFGETPGRHNEYTPEEVASLQARLDKKLGPEYISSRPGAAGQKVHYLAADKCINLANEIFGFNGWSSSIQNIQIDFVDESPNTGKVNLGLSVIVRVTLKDGSYHEDLGYGHIENCKGKAAAFEKAKKEATTDALKRALRNFGNVLGNCVYDKDYVSKVTKVRTIPTKLAIEELHRHPDFAPIKKEPVQPKPPPEDDDLPPLPSLAAQKSSSADNMAFDYDGEFGSDVFDEADFNVDTGGNPDEVVIDSGTRRQLPPTPIGKPNQPISTPSKPERPINQGPGARHIPGPLTANNRPYPPPAADQYGNYRRSIPPHDPQRGFQNGRPVPPGPQRTSHDGKALTSTAHVPVKQEFGAKPQNATGNPTPVPGTPGANNQRPPSIGFFSARGVDNAAANATPFDPHAESPSIPKTAGIDHTKSVPISRPMLAGVSPAANSARDFINPSADMHRKIGAPGGSGIGSPMNRGPSTSSYRPLTRPSVDLKTAATNVPPNRGGFGSPNINGKRPPLSDVTNASGPGGSGPAPVSGANDPKRARFDEAVPQQQQQQQQNQQQQPPYQR